jgi:hypothetical protein
MVNVSDNGIKPTILNRRFAPGGMDQPLSLDVEKLTVWLWNTWVVASPCASVMMSMLLARMPNLNVGLSETLSTLNLTKIWGAPAR